MSHGRRENSGRLPAAVLVSAFLGTGSPSGLVTAFQPQQPVTTQYDRRTKHAASASSLHASSPLNLNDPWDDLTSRIVGTASPDLTAATQKTVDGFQLPSFNVKSVLGDVTSKVALPKTPDWTGLTSATRSEEAWKTLFSNNNINNEWLTALQQSASQNDILPFLQHLPLYQQAALVATPVTLLLSLLIFNTVSQPQDGYRTGMEPYPRGAYDPITAQAYYSRHPVLVATRAAQMLRLSYAFLFQLALDKYVWKREVQNRAQRAPELLALIQQLGPTAIKVGQALSVRPDLVPPEYASALSTLQDQVPPFANRDAKALLQSQLGATKYQELGLDSQTKPVASASIGQVYKGRIGDRDVAVKVQRPNVLAEIALDLHIVYQFAPIYQKLTRAGTDLQSLANEWGRGFIAELDYTQEAAATIRFNEEMEARKLNAVCAPTVVSGYSTEQILVTEWVDGTRLDQSDAADVPRLCAVALNAYLVMLLELKSLHCDPHPGNLLRTRDGRLCILDFGMTLEVAPTLQYSLLEFVAHLTSEDYDLLPEDLAALGFLKRDKLDFAVRSGALEPLKYFLRQAGKGGGANGVRDRIFDDYRLRYPGLSDDELRLEMRSEMKQQMADIVERESVATGITVQVEELQKQNRDAFQIPEWFLYSSRAFLTLEGVSLQASSDYSLIQSCFPYVAKRLVGDNDPRARKALRDLLYGATDSVDVKRLTDLADGFTSYTTTTKSINKKETTKNSDGTIVVVNGALEKDSHENERKQKLVEAEATITLAKDSADIFLSPDENLVQSLFVEEGALAASAQFKDSVRDTFLDGPKRFRSSLPLGIGSLLPPLPFEDQVAPFLRKTERETKAQLVAEKIALLVPQSNNAVRDQATPEKSANPNAIPVVLQSLRELEPELAALVLKEMRENLPKYGPMVGQLGGKFVSTLLHTASHNIETTLTELELAGEQPDETFRTTVKTISSAAQRGATAISQESSVETRR